MTAISTLEFLPGTPGLPTASGSRPQDEPKKTQFELTSQNLLTGSTLPQADARRKIYLRAIQVQHEAQALIERLNQWEMRGICGGH